LLEDPTRRFDLPAVLDMPESYWTPAPDCVLRPGLSRSAWWLRLRLRNRGHVPLSLVLEAAQPLQDFLDFHLLRGGQPIRTYPAGDFRPFRNRALAHRHFALPIELQPGEPGEVLIRIESRGGVYAPVPLRLRETADFAGESLQANLLLGLHFGGLIALLALHALLFASTREPLFLAFSVYLALSALARFGVEGFGFQYLWPESPRLGLLLDIPLPALILASGTLLTIGYLDTRRRSPTLHRFILILTGLLALPLAVALADALGFGVPIVEANYLLQILGIALPPLFLLSATIAASRGYRPARLYAAAWAVEVVGILAFVFHRESGFLPAHWPVEGSLAVASLLHFLLLALALGDRRNRIKDETLEAEHRLLQLQSAQADQLETLVRERTAELRQAMRRIEDLARTDELTQLNNLRAFNDLFHREFARARRERHLLAFALVDLDHFKRYNDHYGHAAGDEVLRQTAAVLRSRLRRSSDYAFRLGGEEFGILLGHTESEVQAARLIEQIRAEIQHLAIPHVGNDAGVVTCSIGLAFNRGLPDPSPESLYRRADEFLYRAKRGGRNRLTFSGADGEDHVTEAPV
jgi:diguanylate cyclase (GGDEF)-like protein